MFYVELKDGSKFFTDRNSDDKKEFEKIIDDKLGSQAAEIFDSLITESGMVNDRILNRYKSCIKQLESEISKPVTDTDKLSKILQDLKEIYIELS